MEKKKFRWGNLWQLIKETYKEFNRDDPFRLSAIVAYYAVLSMPAMLVIIISLAGFFLGEQAVRGEISTEISEIMGESAADQVETMLVEASEYEGSTWAIALGIGMLLFGASTMFYHLQKSLNFIWGVKAQPKKGWLKFLLDRLASLGLVFFIGIMLLAFMVVSALISAFSDWLTTHFTGYMIMFIHVLNFVVSVGVITVLFAIILRFMPDVEIKWHTVWVGAFVTALLFVIGKTLLGIYFGYSNPASTYGAAGSIVLILLWVSYSALIFFFGAEFTQVYARFYGDRIEPSQHAVRTAAFKEWLEKHERTLEEGEDRED